MKSKKRKNKKLYAIHPGSIVSVNDGKKHYIGFYKLIFLYKLNRKDCILWDNTKPITYLCRNWKDYIHIYPQKNAKDYIIKGENNGE